MMKQLLRADSLGFHDAFDGGCPAERFDFLHDRFGFSKASIGVLQSFAENGGDAVAVEQRFHGFGGILDRAERAAKSKAERELIHVVVFHGKLQSEGIRHAVGDDLPRGFRGEFSGQAEG